VEDNQMNIISATLVSTADNGEELTVLKAVIDGVTMSVPMDPHNRHYKEILRQTKAGRLTIAEAEVSGE
jgi:hypothetical protein